jgi:hypothetical protein
MITSISAFDSLGSMLTIMSNIKFVKRMKICIIFPIMITVQCLTYILYFNKILFTICVTFMYIFNVIVCFIIKN